MLLAGMRPTRAPEALGPINSGVEGGVVGRLVVIERNVEADTVGHLKVDRGVPLVLCVKAKEAGLEGGSPFGGAGDSGVGILVNVGRWCGIVEEVLDGVVDELTIGGLDEGVLHVVILIVETEGEGVRAGIDGEVVLGGPDVLVEEVDAR